MAGPSKKQTSKRDRELERAERERLETALEVGLLGTFPASDAVAVTQPVAEPTVHRGPEMISFMRVAREAAV